MVMLPSDILKLPTDLPVRGFVETSPSRPSPGQVSVPISFVTFCLLCFVLPPFKEKGLPFWVPGVLLQHSQVVLWKLLSIQRVFR